MRIGLNMVAEGEGVWTTLAVMAKGNPKLQFCSAQQPPKMFEERLSADVTVVDVWLFDRVPDKPVRHPYLIWFTGDESFFRTDAITGVKDFFRHRRLRQRLKKASGIFVPTPLHVQQLKKQFAINEHQIHVLPQMISPCVTSDKDQIKQIYWDGQEAFAALGNDFILALKSFSIFKKRQQSGWKMVWFTNDDSTAQQSLEGYKYRNDVLIRPLADAHKILPAAHATLCAAPGLFWHPLFTTALLAGVPVITQTDSAVAATCREAMLLVNETTAEAVGEAMMQLYKNEELHRDLSTAATRWGNKGQLETTVAALEAVLAAAAPTFVAPKTKE